MIVCIKTYIYWNVHVVVLYKVSGNGNKYVTIHLWKRDVYVPLMKLGNKGKERQVNDDRDFILGELVL